MSEQKLKPLNALRKSPSLQQIFDQIIMMTEKITIADGSTQTIVPFLSIDRHNHQTRLSPCVLTPSFCLNLQGTKNVHVGTDIINFLAGDYLTSMLNIPASTQVIGATDTSAFRPIYQASQAY